MTTNLDAANEADTCLTCGLELADREVGNDNSCPRCGGNGRKIMASCRDTLVMHDSLGTTLKRPSLPSAKKLRAQSFDGVVPSHKYGKLVRKHWYIDKDKDEYFERVTDIATGETLHECIEPLSKHRGHGTAKPKEPRGSSDQSADQSGNDVSQEPSS